MMKKLGIFALLILVLAGCGGGPKSDVPVFIFPQKGITSEITEKLESGLKQRVGETPTVEVMGSPVFDRQKLVVEIAAGGHSIIIVDEESYRALAGQGGLVDLDDTFDPKKYPGGVVEADMSDDGKTPKLEKHFYGVPVGASSWLKEAGYTGPELYAFILPKAKDVAKAKQVLKTIVEK